MMRLFSTQNATQILNSKIWSGDKLERYWAISSKFYQKTMPIYHPIISSRAASETVIYSQPFPLWLSGLNAFDRSL